MFIRKVMDPETFRSFTGVMAKAINIDKRSHSITTIFDALRATVMDRVPLRARQAKIFRHCKKKGLMGRKGENCRTFTEDLLFDLSQSGWDQLSTNHFGCLLWLEDLDTNDHNQHELANCIHQSWDRADEWKETFTALDGQQIALTFWSGSMK